MLEPIPAAHVQGLDGERTRYHKEVHWSSSQKALIMSFGVIWCSLGGLRVLRKDLWRESEVSRSDRRRPACEEKFPGWTY